MQASGSRLWWFKVFGAQGCRNQGSSEDYTALDMHLQIDSTSL